MSLPGGRGEWRKSEDRLSRDQLYFLRQKQLPEFNELFIMNTPSIPSNLTLTQDRLLLAPVHIKSKGVVATFASMIVNNSAAGSSVRVGIYRYTRGSEAELHLVPQTEVVIDSTGTGEVGTDLARTFNIQPNTFYLIGTTAQSGTPQLKGNRVGRGLRLDGVSGDLPSRLRVSTLTRADIEVPQVVYYSQEGKDLFVG